MTGSRMALSKRGLSIEQANAKSQLTATTELVTYYAVSRVMRKGPISIQLARGDNMVITK